MNKPTKQQIEAEVDKAMKNSNVFLRGMYMIMSSAFIFSVLGGLAGWFLSLTLPGYFRNVYDAADSEIWQVAVGLGLTRGFLLGIFLSSVVLLATAWYRSRIKNTLMQHYDSGQQFDTGPAA